MTRPRVLAAILLAALAATASPARASESIHCGDSGYSYAGLLGSALAYGVAADVRVQSLPRVRSGHVAAWVGVGGYGLGRNGTNAWLQAGLITRAGGAAVVYYEVTRPGYKPKLTPIRSAVTGRSYRVAVLEMAQRPGWWRVWVDGRPVTKPISLPGSHGAWEPTATAESWDGGESVCNEFNYSFDRIAVATRPGGDWRPLTTASVLQAPGYRVVGRTLAGFVAKN